MSPEQNGTEEIPPELEAIDPAVLQEVVRRDRRDPDFRIGDWAAEPVGQKGFADSEALFRIYGNGSGESTGASWSVVLKILHASERELDPREPYYWRRELLLAQSGLLENLPGPLLAARMYDAADYGATAWVWMQYLVDSAPERWSLEQFIFAARQLGRFSAPYLTGLGIPDYFWLVTEHCRRFSTGRTPMAYLEDPLVRQTMPESLRRRLVAFWPERERLFGALACLPQVFSQGDYQRRNLFIRRRTDGADELVAVDWAMCGRRAIGEDLWDLVPGGVLLCDWEFDAIAELEKAAFEAYLAGLSDAGYAADPEMARLGYVASTALCIGAVVPLGIAIFGQDEMRETDLRKFGRPPEELVRLFVALEEYALDRSDEARRLMARLGMD
jgi:hypothetical protein